MNTTQNKFGDEVTVKFNSGSWSPLFDSRAQPAPWTPGKFASNDQEVTVRYNTAGLVGRFTA